jgi:hypothetical protein
MTQEALPALSNQNDEEAVRDEKGPETFILSLAQDTKHHVGPYLLRQAPNSWDGCRPMPGFIAGLAVHLALRRLVGVIRVLARVSTG